jgi:UDP-N-acetylmuramate dehydrogenase
MNTPLDIRENVPLGPLTTLQVGGAAEYYLQATSLEDVEGGEGWAHAWDVPLLVLGGGSNVVLADEGFAGLVLHVDVHGVDTTPVDGGVEIDVAAGEEWDDVVAMTVKNGWTGLECLSGIPGRVGATPIQNVGAYGQEVSETITHVRVIDRKERRLRSLSNEECGFGYRTSRLKREDRDRFVVLGVRFRLRAGARPEVKYADVVADLKGIGAWPPTVNQVRQSVLGIRRRKSMVLDPADPNHRSVGSFFLNPVVKPEVLESVRARLRSAGESEAAGQMPAFQAADGQFKLSAAWLIEKAGFERGHERGRVGLSTNHALALVNRGGATASEVVALAAEVHARVHDRFGLNLEPEPALLGVRLK